MLAPFFVPVVFRPVRGRECAISSFNPAINMQFVLGRGVGVRGGEFRPRYTAPVRVKIDWKEHTAVRSASDKL